MNLQEHNNNETLNSTLDENNYALSNAPKKRRADNLEEQLNIPSLCLNSSTDNFNYQMVPFVGNTDSSLTHPLTVDTQLNSEVKSLVRSNELVTKSELLQDDVSMVDQALPAKDPEIKAASVKAVRKYIYEDYVRKFEQLRELQPVPEDFGGVTTGFTRKQLTILEDQMRVYTQLSVQHFVQTYSHPRLWDKANQFKTNLNDFRNTVNKTSLSVCNLENALDFMERWEQDLSEEKEENEKHIKFIEDQINRGKYGTRNMKNILRFPPKIMQAILTEEAFLYPELVPKVAFRCDRHSNESDFAPSEVL